jgi:hypothetical protein
MNKPSGVLIFAVLAEKPQRVVSGPQPATPVVIVRGAVLEQKLSDRPNVPSSRSIVEGCLRFEVESVEVLSEARRGQKNLAHWDGSHPSDVLERIHRQAGFPVHAIGLADETANQRRRTTSDEQTGGVQVPRAHGDVERGPHRAVVMGGDGGINLAFAAQVRCGTVAQAGTLRVDVRAVVK